MTYIGKMDSPMALLDASRWTVEPAEPPTTGWRSWRLTSAVARATVQVLSKLPGNCTGACCQSRWALWRALREFVK